jgi:hypothetical protein
VVAVCHAGVIMASLRCCSVPAPRDRRQLRPTNTGLTEWEHDPERDRWTLHSFNEASHLLGPPPASDLNTSGHGGIATARPGKGGP